MANCGHGGVGGFLQVFGYVPFKNLISYVTVHCPRISTFLQYQHSPPPLIGLSML